MKFSNQFIKANNELCSFEQYVPAPYFRKKFMLDFKPESGEITICGLGFYELSVNGKPITKGAMAPYISNTDEVCYYDNYDITSLLKEGENVIGVLLGNGMRNPYGGFIWDFDKDICGDPLVLALCLEARKGEKTFELEADESFRTASSPIVYNDLRMGYCYDAREELTGWDALDFDDSGWQCAMPAKKPCGIAKLCEAEPIVVTEERKPVKMTHYDELPYAYEKKADGKTIESTLRKNVYVYDFGINSAGLTKLHINGKPGQKITIRHGEETVNGKFAINTMIFLRQDQVHNERYLQHAQTDVFICKGGEETFVPKFKYDGFRYAYVEGLEEEQAEGALTMLVMNSDLQPRADFSCSDEVINKLFACARNSDLSNFYYFPTDCPHREKNGWTGDASVSAEHMLLNLTAEKSLAEWMANVREAQRSDGVLPGIVPTGNWGVTWGNGPAWDSVCVSIPYYVYKYTGDKKIIEDNFFLIMRYLAYVMTRRDDRGLIAFGLGDWVDPRGNQNIAAPLELTDSITIYDFAKKAAFLFDQIGKRNEADYAGKIAEEMRTAIRKHLLDKETMTMSGECQTSQAFALACGIFDEAELPMARQRLLDIIHRDGDINACGMIGLRHIYHVLSDMGESELAYKIITATHQHCYGYWIASGATSLWESFGKPDSAASGSKNHHFLGDISSWFIQELAGLKPNPDATDISRFEVSPKFIPQLSFAKAHFVSRFGKVATEWRREGETVILSLTAPDGTWGEICLPEGYAFADGTDVKVWKGKTDWQLEVI